ncbi:MAG: hypothetical protein ACM3UN_02785 [Bacillota bacterium]
MGGLMQKISNRLGILLVFFVIMLASFSISMAVVFFTNVWMLSAINLYAFCFFLSTVLASLIIFLRYREQLILKVRKFSALRILFGLALVVIACVLAFQYFFVGFSLGVFHQWTNIFPLSLVFSVFSFVATLYAPAYVLHQAVLRNFQFKLLEKVVFYPVISALMLGALGFFFINSFSELLPITNLVLFFIASVFLFYRHFRERTVDSNKQTVSIDLSQVLVIVSIILFSSFLFYCALGMNGFIVGDMWGDAHKVSLISKFGVDALFSSPVDTGYPPFFYIFWSAIVGVTPLPIVNGLILTAFFNHTFVVLSIYLLARSVFKNSGAAVLSAVLWVIFSNFSWTGVLVSPPADVLSGGDLLTFITSLYNRFGFYSGARISTIYADGHSLTRLWALGLFFVSAAAAVKACSDKKYLKEGLFVFSIGIMQILLGHMTEVPMLSLILFISFLILKPDTKSYRIFALFLGSLTAISCLLTFAIFGANYIYLLISILPFFAFVTGISFLKLLTFFKMSYVLSSFKENTLNRKIVLSLCIFLVCLYGFMLFAFFQRGGNISYPIATVWYLPAVEWGFLGLVAVITLVWFGLRRISFNIGLKVALSIVGSQLLLLLCLNLLNYYYRYIENPYPFEPILFLPFLALVGSQFFVANRVHFKLSRVKVCFITLILIIAFSFATLDNVVNVSYIRVANGWWSSVAPISISNDDFQLMNFLYNSPSVGSYEFVGTFNDWNSPSGYVVYPSGGALLSPPLIDILSTTNDSKEFYQLTDIFPIQFVLVPKSLSLPASGFLASSLNTAAPVLNNEKYLVYSVSELNASQTTPLDTSGFLAFDELIVHGSIAVKDLNGSSVFVNGDYNITTGDNGTVWFSSNSGDIARNFTSFKPSVSIEGIASFIGMKSSWTYFREIGCVADNLTISGSVSFKVANTFSTRVYTSDFQYSGPFSVYPPKDNLDPNTIREQIDTYFGLVNISLLTLMVTPFGFLWSIINLVLLCAVWRKDAASLITRVKK